MKWSIPIYLNIRQKVCFFRFTQPQSQERVEIAHQLQ
jgi:hypothetical protein